MKFTRAYRSHQITRTAKSVLRKVLKRPIGNPTFLRELSPAAGNRLIYEKIESGDPFCAIRGGGTELRMVADILYARETGKRKLSKWAESRVLNTGFFPNEFEKIEEFVDLYVKSLQKADVLSVWDAFMQEYFVKRFSPHADTIALRSLEPYYFDDPWSERLADKKVLVIHPFADSIARQYKNRKNLFDNKKVLPEFDLITMKAVQTIAGTPSAFPDWISALDDMFDNAMKKSFDIALIGCGAYGLPLSVKIREQGKQAIQVSGALQLLFGIKGKRWDRHLEISKLYNEYWIRPDETERPASSNKVESGCFW